MLSSRVAANGIRLSIQRTAGRECSMEAISQDSSWIYFQSVEFIVDCGLRIAVAGYHCLQEVLYHLELEIGIRQYNIAQWSLFSVADSIDQGHYFRIKPFPLCIG